MSVAQTAHSQFEQAYQLVGIIAGPVGAQRSLGRVRANCCATGVRTSTIWPSRFSRCVCV